MELADLPTLILACGVLALIYGLFTIRYILAQPKGNTQMIEIAAAIQEGAKAYLNRQYMTIALVGVAITAGLGAQLSWLIASGFVIGAVMSGIAGYIGMSISVRANVRTTEAARSGMQKALSIAFQSGAVTGMLVVGLGLLGTAGYYFYLREIGTETRTILEALVALSFGASLI